MRDTSIAAKKTIDAKSIESIVYEHIKNHGRRGVTCDEVEVALNLRHQTASARFTALFKRGDIVDSGERRPTRSGRKAIAWRTPERRPPEQTKLF